MIKTGRIRTFPKKKLSNSVKPTVIAIGSEVDQGLRDRIKTAVGVDLWK